MRRSRRAVVLVERGLLDEAELDLRLLRRRDPLTGVGENIEGVLAAADAEESAGGFGMIMPMRATTQSLTIVFFRPRGVVR